MIGSCSLRFDDSLLESCASPKSVKPTKRDQFTVCVEGNIGCGKSTFLEYFGATPCVEIFPEPVAQWKDVHGHNTLELMYQDARRWSLAFQSYVQLTMMAVHSKDSKCPVKLMERSIFSARACFVENLFRGGTMPDFDYEVLNQWYEWIAKKKANAVDLVVYLRADPEVCLERVKIRNRNEETGIPLSYLQSLHDLHEDWLMTKNKFPVPAPVLVLDANKDISELKEIFEAHRDEVLCGFA